MLEIIDTQRLGRLIRRARKARGLTQIGLAREAGMGERFIVDLEHGKPTCEVGRVLRVMGLLNLTLRVEPPVGITPEALEHDVALLGAGRRKPREAPARPVPNPSP